MPRPMITQWAGTPFYLRAALGLGRRQEAELPRARDALGWHAGRETRAFNIGPLRSRWRLGSTRCRHTQCTSTANCTACSKTLASSLPKERRASTGTLRQGGTPTRPATRRNSGKIFTLHADADLALRLLRCSLSALLCRPELSSAGRPDGARPGFRQWFSALVSASGFCNWFLILAFATASLQQVQSQGVLGVIL